MKILIGYSTCPLTAEAFRSQDIETWTCDLLPYRGENQSFHLQEDIWGVLTKKWDFAILHPMCTYLTTSAASFFLDPDFERWPEVGYHQRLQEGTLFGEARRNAKEVALNNFRRLLDLPYPVAVENPCNSFINTSIRRYDQKIQPYEYGDDASKGTGLWLTKGVPLLKPTQFVPPRSILYRGKQVNRWANQAPCGAPKAPRTEDRWLRRSDTYPGIAAALGSQWGQWLKEKGDE